MSNVRCSRCGYDLREHELHELCPECGAAVALVFKEHPWWSGEMQVRLRKGLVCLVGSLVVLILVLLFGMIQARMGLSVFEFMVVLAAGQQALWLAGIWQATWYKNRELASLQPWMGLPAGIMTAALVALCVVNAQEGARSGWVDLGVRMLVWAGVLGSCACLAGWLALLARLMEMRRYMWHFVVVGTVLAMLGSMEIAGGVGLIGRFSSGTWVDAVGLGRLPLLPMVPVLWLTAVCAWWAWRLQRENAALGLGV
jgi:hypothetical protein